jgi:hypothetical protein
MIENLAKYLFIDVRVICCIPKISLKKLFLSHEIMRVQVGFKVFFLSCLFIIFIVINLRFVRINTFSSAYKSNMWKTVIKFKRLGRARRRQVLIIIGKWEKIRIAANTRRC